MEMVKAAAIRCSGNLHRLIRNAGPREPNVSEMIKEPDGTLSETFFWPVGRNNQEAAQLVYSHSWPSSYT